MKMRIEFRGLALVALACGCSSGGSTTGSAMSGSGTAGSGSTASAGSVSAGNAGSGSVISPGSGSATTGTVSGSAGTSAATGTLSGATGSSGMTGQGTGSLAPDGSATVDAGGSDDVNASDAPHQAFSCTLLLAPFQTSQWFTGGFQAAVGASKWEIKWAHNAYTENWANPTDGFWGTAIMGSACAMNSTAPDRVFFTVYSKTITGEAAWETAVTKVVDNIKAKYPTAKQIVLIGMARAPNNQPCPNNNDVALVVTPEEEQAMKAVADKSAGLVTVGPAYGVTSCAYFVMNNTNLQGNGAKECADALIPFYK